MSGTEKRGRRIALAWDASQVAHADAAGGEQFSCLDCGGSLDARQDGGGRHFVHVGDDCGSGAASALRRFARQILAETGRPLFALPPVGVVPGETVPLSAVELGARVSPRLRCDALGRHPDGAPICVEFAVTGFAAKSKVAEYAEHGLRAVEVDLSGIDVSASAADIARAILVSAPRVWLFHPLAASVQVEAGAKAEQEERQIAVMPTAQMPPSALVRAKKTYAEEVAERQSRQAADLAAFRARIAAGKAKEEERVRKLQEREEAALGDVLEVLIAQIIRNAGDLSPTEAVGVMRAGAGECRYEQWVPESSEAPIPKAWSIASLAFMDTHDILYSGRGLDRYEYRNRLDCRIDELLPEAMLMAADRLEAELAAAE